MAVVAVKVRNMRNTIQIIVNKTAQICFKNTRRSLAVLFILAVAISATAFGTGAADAAAGSVKEFIFGTGAKTAATKADTRAKAANVSGQTFSSAFPSVAVTNNLINARQGHTATALDDGGSSSSVLIVGGDVAAAVGSAEIFNAATGTSTPVADSLATARAGHTATKIGGGRVLIAGGRDVNGASLKTTEIYNPAAENPADLFSAGPDMVKERSGHTATVLGNGKILIAGGDGAGGSAEIYDPATNSFTLLEAEMTIARSNHSAVLMNDGRVFIAGGEQLNSAEIFAFDADANTSGFTATGNAMAHHRERAVLRVLPDGKVQIIGGNGDTSMEVYDPAINTIGAHAHLIPTGDEHDALLRDDILNAPTRAALFHNGQDDALLDRENHTITELGARALVTGGRNTAGEALNSFALLNSSAATVTTDKLDYSPGQTAIISGTGWQGGETVNIILHEDPHTHTERRLTATANSDGNFQINYLVEAHDFGVTFIVGAKGSSSGRTAQTTFTDARQFQVAITPTSAAQNVSQSYQITVTNNSTNNETIGSVEVTIPAGVGTPTSMSVVATESDGVTIRPWSAPTSTSGRIRTNRTGGNTNQIGVNGTVKINFTTTITTTGAKTFTTSVYGGNDYSTNPHSISGSQPSVTVTTANSAPSINRDNATVTVNEGATASNTGIWSDANAGDTVTLSAAPVGTVTKSGTNAGGAWSWSYPTTDNAATQTVTISANDGTANSSTTFNLTVNNVAPTAAFNAPASVDQNAALNLSLTNPVDPSSADTTAGFTYAFDCGDGAGYGAFGASGSANCSTSTVGTRTVKGKIRDKDNGETEYTQSVIVRALTTVSAVSGSGTYGGTATLTATLTQTTGGAALNNQTVSFTLNGNPVCGGATGVTCPTTNASGVAALSNVSLTGVNAGTYAGAIGASFAGDANNAGGSGSGALSVAKANQTINFAALGNKIFGDPDFTVSATATSGLAVSFAASGKCSMANGSTVHLTGAGSCAITASQPGDDNYNAAPDVPQSFSIAKAQATLNLSNLNQTYDAAPKSATVTTNPSGLTGVAVTYDGSATAPTNAGSYAVVASLTNDNYEAPNAGGTLVINKATATVTLGGLAHTYDGSAKAAAATTDPSGLTVNLAYSQSGNPVASPTSAGNYDVTATVSDANYQGGATGVLNIAQATPTINVVGGTVLYDGNPHPATAAATGVGGANVSGNFAFTYTPPGDAAAPINAGTYGVTVNFTSADPNYANASGSGSVIINQAGSTTTVSVGNATYNGSPHGGTASAIGAGGLNQSLTVTYAGRNGTIYPATTTAPTNAGDYTASASFAGDANHTGSSDSKDFSIFKASVTATAGGGTTAYDGAAKSPAACVVTGAYTGDLTCANNPASVGPGAGTTQIAPSVSGTGLSNFEINSVNGSYTIEKAGSTTTVSCPPFVTYNGSAQTPCSVSVTGAGGLSLTPNPDYSNNTNAGTATAGYNYAGDDNHTGSSDSKQFAINKAAVTATGGSGSSNYDGATKSPAACAVTGAYTGNLSCANNPNTVGPGAGTTAIMPNVSGSGLENFEITSVNGSYTINKATAAINVTPYSVTYNGAAHTASGSATGAAGENLTSLLDLSGTTHTNAGTYNNDPWTFAGDANHNPSGGSVNNSIAKAPVTATAGGGAAIYDGAAKSPAACVVTGAYTGDLTCANDPASVGPDAGTTAIAPVVSGTGLSNFNISPVNGEYTIGKAASATLVTCPTNVTYTGAVLEPCSATVTGAGGLNQTLAVTYTNNVNAGTANASAAYAESANHLGSGDNRNFTIDKASQTISFAALPNKYYGNGGITVSATGGGSGNPVTFTSGTPTVCTSGGTNGATVLFVGLGNCAITASQAGSGNYNAAQPVVRSFQINPDPTVTALDLSGHSLSVYDCVNNVIAATVKNTVTNQPVAGVQVTLSVGSQSVVATTDGSGKASGALVLNQTVGPNTAGASFAGGGFLAGSSVSQNVTITPNTNVGPGRDAESLYTGSLWFWTTSSTSSTATLTLSATIMNVGPCNGDITKAKVSFLVSANGGTSFSPVSSAQNLPVGLVNPNDPNTGTASAVSQYNIGNSQSVTLIMRVVVGGQYNLSNSTLYDVPISIGKPGQANSLMGGGKLKNDGNPFPANGFLGSASVNGEFGAQVAYTKSGTNPKGDVTVTITSCNRPDGSTEPGCTKHTPSLWHKYFIKSNSISELSLINGSASFGSKTNVSKLMPDGSRVGLDGGNTMQLVFTPYGKPFPAGMAATTGNCMNQAGCASVVIYRSNGLGGGLWYSSSWGQVGASAPKTYLKNVASGNVSVQ
jgi:hypothetical protein